MKKIVVMAALLLGGCATVERPQMHAVPRAQPVPVIVPAPVAPPATDKPATFKQRFRQGFGKIKWLHKK